MRPRRCAISISIEFEHAVQLPERGVLPQIARRCGRPRFAAGIEIAPRKKIAYRYYGGPHGTVFVGPLRPGYIVRHPQVKAHRDYFSNAFPRRLQLRCGGNICQGRKLGKRAGPAER
jgi:hypothetical protein